MGLGALRAAGDGLGRGEDLGGERTRGNGLDLRNSENGYGPPELSLASIRGRISAPVLPAPPWSAQRLRRDFDFRADFLAFFADFLAAFFAFFAFFAAFFFADFLAFFAFLADFFAVFLLARFFGAAVGAEAG